MKLLTIVGARPQFIKAAAVSRVIRKSHGVKEILVHTGQHFDQNMSDVFFKEMEIPEPDYFLEINSLSHGAMTGRMIESIESVLQKESPDLVLVYGDTNSTLAGSLAAIKLNIRLAHVEAGLRSFNMKMPEEINRILTDRISDLLFCPTENAVKNLKNEGFENFNSRIYQPGDVMYDAAMFYGAISNRRSDIIDLLKLGNSSYILCSVHRQENTDDIRNLKSIVEALNQINKDIPVVLPLHPRTRKILDKNNLFLDFKPIDPVGYFAILELLKHCSLVVTDSGGMQKEAFFFDKYCLTLRSETEWTELVDHGFNKLCGADRERIITSYRELINKPFKPGIQLYGNGDASSAIVDIIKAF